MAYMIVLLPTIAALNAGVVPQSLRAPLALLPMIPCIYVALIIAQAIRAADELVVRIQFEALAFAFAFTAIVTFSYGFLETFAGFPSTNLFVVWPIMAAFWIVGGYIARRRYR